MAVNFLSDELKSDITFLVPPITKEQIVKEVNAIIYHLKTFGICFTTDINYPSGSDYLASVDAQTIVKDHFGAAVSIDIDNLFYLYIPIELHEIVTQINTIVNILKKSSNGNGTAGSTITGSYYLETLRNEIYNNTPNLVDRDSYTLINYNNDLKQRINQLQNLEFPVGYSELIDVLNNIIGLFKVNSHIVDANDFRLLINALKEELNLIPLGEIDYGNSSSTPVSTDQYGKAKNVYNEWQSNEVLSDLLLIDSNDYLLLDKDNFALVGVYGGYRA